jgi:hypothetical protein
MQSFLFADSLRKQMDAMESKAASNRAKLEKMASSYREMGLSTDEIKELVSIDSHSVDPQAVDAFVDVFAGTEVDEMYRWDFTIRDGRGKKWSASTYGLSPVTAATREDAIEIAARSLRKILSADDMETVVDAERISI